MSKAHHITISVSQFIVQHITAVHYDHRHHLEYEHAVHQEQHDTSGFSIILFTDCSFIFLETMDGPYIYSFVCYY
jgi:hypothetical protein